LSFFYLHLAKNVQPQIFLALKRGIKQNKSPLGRQETGGCRWWPLN